MAVAGEAGSVPADPVHPPNVLGDIPLAEANM